MRCALIVLLAVMAGGGQLRSENLVPGIVPWQPTLIRDRSPDLCARFEAGLQTSFRRGWPGMRERHFSNDPTPPDPIATAFPGAQWVSGNGANPFTWTAQDVFYHWSTGIPIFAFDGAYYTYRSTAWGTGQLHTENSTQEYSLIRLDGPTAQPEICRVLFYPAQTSLDAVIAKSPFLSGLMPLYGGRRREAQNDADREGTCDGTSGWSGVDPRSAMMTVFFRPELMMSSYSAPDPVEDLDTERERRLLDWATTDPTAWRTYGSMRQDRLNFTGMMEEYYVQKLGLERPEAAILARKAYVFLIDHVLFTYSNSLNSLDGSPVPIVAEPFPHLNDTPGEVADRATIASGLPAITAPP